jgi:hypothetical protein
VRVQIPRELPTEDQLVVRERRDAPGSTKKPPSVPVPPLGAPFKAAETWLLYEPNARAGGKPGEVVGPEPEPGVLAQGPWAALCLTSNEVRQVAGRSARLVAQAKLRAVFAVNLPLGLVSQLAGHGVVVFKIDDAAYKALKGQREVQAPAPSALVGSGASVMAGKNKVNVTWVAHPGERGWVTGGSGGSSAGSSSSRPAAPAPAAVAVAKR